VKTICVALLLCLNWILPAVGAQPNILVLISDDQGWGDLSLNGNTNLHTPNIDSLGRQGVLFERFYVSPVCSPTRAEFLTGRYHPRGGVTGVTSGGERLNLAEQTLPQVLRAVGYVTGAFGKWHNGTQYPYHPLGRGFDEFYGFCSGHWGTYFDAPMDHNGQPVTGRGYLADDIVDHALSFVETNRVQPFLCYVAFNTPHSPMQVPDQFYQHFANRPISMRADDRYKEDMNFTRAALAMCENIDWNVGRILARLDQLGLTTNTIVLYFSDNGPNSFRWNGGMKGRKGSVDEGGVRSPLVIRWPEKLSGGVRVGEITGAIDLLPTLTDLAGITWKPREPLDGLSLVPLLRGDLAATWPNRLLFSHWNNRVSVRSQQFRLDPEGGLFDMQVDGGQRTNLAPTMPEVARRFTEARETWRRNVLEASKSPQRPFTVGYMEFPRAELPARDGVAHGAIRRSADAPNCSYFTHWTSTNDFISWDIESAKAGPQEVELLYTCAANNTGVRLQVECGNAVLRAIVDQPHDPPLKGAENDRVPRHGESYVKDFRSIRLGKIEIPRGRSTLVIRATQIPGTEAIDLRSVVLSGS
jgi:arylsulfatase A-like enzyme